ncbi:MAG TPA: SAM-dependent methyltransferase [Methanocella sp.]|nr:SAM-dependent methyltransferase [Methanocella sp.]
MREPSVDLNPFTFKADDKYTESTRPTKTAEMMAMVRARESISPEGERICSTLMPPLRQPETLAFAAREPEKFRQPTDQTERLIPGHANSVAARARYIDDTMTSSANSVRQPVLIEARYDTRAYRIEGAKKLKVFKVDHPNTQKLKKRKIKEIFGSLPTHITYVPTNLEIEYLEERLRAGGYNPSLPTLFVMEGL